MRALWVLVFLAGGVLAATIVLHQGPTHQEVLLPRVGDLTAYVGAEKCAECHQGICDRQSGSRMATALHTSVDYCKQHSLPLPAEVIDPNNDLHYRIDIRNDELGLEVSQGSDVVRARMDFALGSGQRGLTFVRDLDQDNYQELRISYYATTNSWDFTPGQEDLRPRSLEEALGRPVAKLDSFACLNCHASRLLQTDQKIDAAASRFGVDCERCHGPGRDHIQTALAGRPSKLRSPALAQALVLAERLLQGTPAESTEDEFLQRVAQAGDERLIRDLCVCGECHGKKQLWIEADDPHLARFQVAALISSPCYERSETKISCTDCHDPHQDAVHDDESAYVAVCLRCHRQPQGGPDSSRSPDHEETSVCPTGHVTGCIGCHMPATSPMYRTRFTHHRIGIYHEERPAAAKANESAE